MRYIASLMIASICACTSGKDEPGAAASKERSAGAGSGSEGRSGSAPSEDEGAEVEVPIPISLLDSTFLAGVQPLIGAFSGTPAAGDTRDADAASPLGVGPSGITAFNDGVGLLGGEIGELVRLQSVLFGADGLLKGKDVLVGASGRVTYHIGEAVEIGSTKAKYAEIRQLPAGQTRAFSARLYCVFPEGLGECARLDFSRGAGEAAAEVDVAYRWGPDASGHRFFFQGTYSTATGKILGTFAQLDPTPLQPSRIRFQVETDAARKNAKLVTAFLWREAVVKESLLFKNLVLARFALRKRREGDLSIYSSQLRSDAGIAALESAFVPVEDRPASGLGGLDLSVFQTQTFARYGLAYLVEVLRRTDVDLDCKTAGVNFRAAGAAAKDLPDDLCQTNAKLSDASLAGVIAELCQDAEAAVEASAVLTPKFGSQKTFDFDLCALYRSEIPKLDNPRYVSFADGPGHFLDPTQMPTAPQIAALTPAIGANETMPLADLESFAWLPLEAAAESDFADAKDPP